MCWPCPLKKENSQVNKTQFALGKPIPLLPCNFLALCMLLNGFQRETINSLIFPRTALPEDLLNTLSRSSWRWLWHLHFSSYIYITSEFQWVIQTINSKLSKGSIYLGIHLEVCCPAFCCIKTDVSFKHDSVCYPGNRHYEWNLYQLSFMYLWIPGVELDDPYGI